MLKFISFGSGSSGNCYYLATATDGLMIDMGVGLRSLRKFAYTYGIQLQNVHHLLITHDHADHIKSVGAFSKEFQVPVYATEAVHEGIYKNYCVVEKVPLNMQMRVKPGSQYKIGEFLVRPFAVPHDASENMGYEIHADGIVFVVITDAGTVTDEMKEAISRANYLIIEANHDLEMLNNGPYSAYLKKRISSATGHLSNSDCGQAIADNMSESLQRVWLCHLSEENNHPELAKKTVEGILRSYGIIPDKDIILEVLRRKQPTGVYDLE